MAVPEQILCIDIGGDSIKAAEFSYLPGESMVLEKFAYSEYSDSADEESSDLMIDALKDIIQNNGFTSRNVHVSISGQSAFIRFVKVPAMTKDKNKIKEIIAFEAKQTIPFSMNEVVWDSQLIEPAPDDMGSEIDAMLVIVKNEGVTRISDAIEGLGKKVTLIEVASTACYNCAKANGIGVSQCEMILNIGGRCSTLVFVDGGRFFVRSIPISGSVITQQISKEFNIPYADAEEMKRRHGFVALGGAYEEPESEVAATVSKIVRNVMTRLHGEINRSINVYRASQHGRKPEKLYLAGGSSILPFTPKFFSEKLRVPVEYFNPFQVVNLSESIDQDMLKDVAHLYGETIGLALRCIGTSPIEISLIPEQIRKQNAFRLKRPYFYASAMSLLAYLGITFCAFHLQADKIEKKHETFNRFYLEKNRLANEVKRVAEDYAQVQAKYDSIRKILESRNNWTNFFNSLQTTIPSNVWFASVSIDANPKTSSNDLSKKGSSKRGRQNSDLFDMDAAALENLDEMKKVDLSKDLKWVNLDGYIYCKKNSLKRQESNEAINLLSSNMMHYGSIFEEKKEPNLTLDDNNAFSVNITHFSYSIELKAPINSEKFSELFTKKNPAEKDNQKSEGGK